MIRNSFALAGSHNASTHQISSKSGYERRSYSSLSIFNMAAVRHLEFCTNWIMTIPQSLENVETHYLLTHQIWCKYFDPRPRYSLKTKFKMAAADSAFLLPVTVLIRNSSVGSHKSIMRITHQISSKSGYARRSYCSLSIARWPTSAILNFVRVNFQG